MEREFHVCVCVCVCVCVSTRRNKEVKYAFKARSGRQRKRERERERATESRSKNVKREEQELEVKRLERGKKFARNKVQEENIDSGKVSLVSTIYSQSLVLNWTPLLRKFCAKM